jgi:hypothetical protein
MPLPPVITLQENRKPPFSEKHKPPAKVHPILDAGSLSCGAMHRGAIRT